MACESNCPHCLDTGSLSKQLDGEYLDCGHCDAATKRAVFNKWARVFATGVSIEGAMWAAHLRGLSNVPDKIDSHANATARDVQRGSSGYSSGDEILAEDIGYVLGWNACVDEAHRG